MARQQKSGGTLVQRALNEGVDEAETISMTAFQARERGFTIVRIRMMETKEDWCIAGRAMFGADFLFSFFRV